MAGKAFDRVIAFYPELADKAKDFFVYSVEYNTLAASAAGAEQQFTINTDADFIVLSISHVEATTTAGTTEQAYAPVTVNILDSGSGAYWFGSAVHLHNVSGRLSGGSAGAAGPFVLPVPRMVNAGSAVTVQATNLESTARRLWISFHGCKVFKRLR